MALLKSELGQYSFAASGIVTFSQYRYLTSHYLLIAVLNSCHSMRVNEQLDVSTTHYLDLEHADIVARIDLTEWQSNPDSMRYLTFLRGRVGRKVADFFIDFLGATISLDSKAQNQQLIQAVDEYYQQPTLTLQDKQSYREQVYNYCQNQLQSGEEIGIAGLSDTLTPVNDKTFQQFTQEQGYTLEPEFPADRTILRQLTKFSGSGKGITLSFDAKLLNERVFWDAKSDTLTIHGLPPNLRDQLQRRTEKEE